MAHDACAIVALGMVTPLGHGAEASAAAIRAGVTRFAELPGIEVDGGPVVGATVGGVTDGLDGLDRFVRLASGAVQDLIANAALGDRGFAAAALYLALPEARPGLDPRIASTIAARIGGDCGLDGLPARTRLFPSGHAGAVAALGQAIEEVRARRISRAIVGGVDSLVDAGTVAHYRSRGRLKLPGRPVGLMPGEAAAFFLVETLASAEARGAAVSATIEAAATAIEPVTVEAEGVCDASGLTGAARRALAALSNAGENIGLVVGDLNGEPYRSEEYAYLVARALAEVKTPFRLWHPADCIGDTGAASAALSIAVASRALRRGYARTDDALVLASSDGGLRGAVVLRSHTSSKPKGG